VDRSAVAQGTDSASRRMFASRSGSSGGLAVRGRQRGSACLFVPCGCGRPEGGSQVRPMEEKATRATATGRVTEGHTRLQSGAVLSRGALLLQLRLLDAPDPVRRRRAPPPAADHRNAFHPASVAKCGRQSKLLLVLYDTVSWVPSSHCFATDGNPPNNQTATNSSSHRIRSKIKIRRFHNKPVLFPI
jgi:hypothetical protein